MSDQESQPQVKQEKNRQDELFDQFKEVVPDLVEEKLEDGKKDTKITMTRLGGYMKESPNVLRANGLHGRVEVEFDSVKYISQKGLQIRNEQFLEELE